MKYTFKIGDQECRVLQFPKPTIIPAIEWVQDSALIWNGSDRGAAQDIYETDVIFYDTEANLNTLYSTLESNREGFSLTDFSEGIFSPNVNHTGTISGTIVKPYTRTQTAKASPSTGMFTLDVRFRAIAPAILSVTPSLSALRLGHKFEAGSSYESKKSFSYDQTAYYQDRRNDFGSFKGSFTQTTAELKSILAYILTTARANTVAFPNIGVQYPFGPAKASYSSLDSLIRNFKITRKAFDLWKLDLEITEVP